MKAFATSLLVVGIAGFETTENNCIYEEGAELIWSGTGFYMNLKDSFTLPGKTTCNVIAFSNV